MDEEMIDQLNEHAMQIIIRAGDARALLDTAYDRLKEKDRAGFDSLIEDAQGHLFEAHRIQTRCIQDQIEAGVNLYSILFSHAQDTLMTINSELEMTKRIGKLVLD